MSRSVSFISSALIPPSEIRDLVVSLGGVHHPTHDDPDSAVLERDDAFVNVSTYLDERLFQDPVFGAAYERALGAPPRTRVMLEVVPGLEGQWLAAEIVLTAADRWPLIVEDLGEAIITLQEFHRRVAQREADFFLPTAYYDPAPGGWLYYTSAEVTLLLPGHVTSEQVFRVIRSLGGWLHDGEQGEPAYAALGRGNARVRAHARPPSFAPVTSQDAVVLGAPPYNPIVLQMSLDPESQLLAVELLEATAVHWPLLVQGPSDQLLTLDDVRGRVETGAQNIFDP